MGGKKKVLFLGGAGEMAEAMLPLLRDEEEIQRVVIADRDLERARVKARQFGEKFQAISLDASDSESLVAAMRGHDAVISYVGPFYRFEKPCAEAAIRAGVSYVSISDDYDAFLAVHELDKAARQAKVKILTGFGNSPGLTQILARKGYNSMDKPREIAVNWAAGANEAVGPANILHVMHFMNGDTLQWRQGRRVALRAGAGRKMVHFPEPIGRIPVFYTGHAESVTLPLFLPGLETVSLHGGCVPTWIFPFAAFLSRLGITKTHRRRLAALKLISPFLPLFSSDRDPDRSVGRVEISGTHEGRPLTRTYTYVGRIADITSLPCFVATKWLLSGRFDEKPGGVYSAEALLDEPGEFLDELEKRGIVMEEIA